MSILILAALGLCATRLASGGSSGPIETPPAMAGLTDFEGRRADPFREAGTNALVIIFVSNDCPIANRYAPEINRLHERYKDRGVMFILVHADPSESVESIRNHTKDFGFACRVLRDAGQTLARFTGATVTPEAVVYAGGRRVYRGRIDDRNVELGTRRVAPTQRDLDEAIRAVLEGKPVATPITRAVGCSIPFER